MKVDLEKLICSLLNEMLENIGKRRNLKFLDIIEALKEQGIEYKDGKLTQIENKPETNENDTFSRLLQHDWDALRNQAAIAAMQGVMNFFGSIDYNRETIARLAVEQADALIVELKKEK